MTYSQWCEAQTVQIYRMKKAIAEQERQRSEGIARLTQQREWHFRRWLEGIARML